MCPLQGTKSLASVLLLYLALPLCGAQKQCYYPAGNVASADVPCDPSAANSACCNPGAFCMGNGLCYSDAILSRGSCTDSTFKDRSCAIYCTASDAWPDRGNGVILCDASRNIFGCYNQSCNETDSLFTMEGANSFVFASSNHSVVQLGPRAVVDLPASSTSQTPSASTSHNATGADASSSSVNGARYTAADMAGVGVGVGLPLLLAILGAVYVILKQRRRLQTVSAQTANVPVMSAQDYATGNGKTEGVGYGSQHHPYDQLLPAQHGISPGVAPPYRPEMDAGASINELGSTFGRQELDTRK